MTLAGKRMQVKDCMTERYKVMSNGERMDSDQLFSSCEKWEQAKGCSYREQLTYGNSCCRIFCMLKIHMAESEAGNVHGGEIYPKGLIQAIWRRLEAWREY